MFIPDLGMSDIPNFPTRFWWQLPSNCLVKFKLHFLDPVMLPCWSMDFFPTKGLAQVTEKWDRFSHYLDTLAPTSTSQAPLFLLDSLPPWTLLHRFPMILHFSVNLAQVILPLWTPPYPFPSSSPHSLTLYVCVFIEMGRVVLFLVLLVVVFLALKVCNFYLPLVCMSMCLSARK